MNYKRLTQGLIALLLVLAVVQPIGGPVGAQDGSYNEAPMLAEMVADGTLPPVEERLPENPRVLDVVNVGDYGGTWRRGYRGVSDRWGVAKLTEEFMIEWAFEPQTGEVTLVPNVAQGWEANEDATEYTFYLRPGMKWSDGEAFNTDDVRFFYEAVALNPNLQPFAGIEPDYTIEILDEYSFKVIYTEPQPLLPLQLASGHGDAISTARSGTTFALPEHYLSQFHPDYASAEELQAAIDEYGVDSWELLWGGEGVVESYYLNPDIPVLSAWKTVTPPPAVRFVMERNPYYFQIDQAGNQLPYIDTVVHDLFESRDVFDLRVVSGEIDMQNRFVGGGDYSLYKTNEDVGGYDVLVWTSASTHALVPNYTTENETLRGLFNDIRFRHALSVAIDRELINELVYLGLRTPLQVGPLSTSPYAYPELTTKWTEYDPDTANALLDEMGLTERNGDGIRLNADGDPIQIEVLYSDDTLNEEIELIRQNFADIGIELQPRLVERSLKDTRLLAGDFEMQLRPYDRQFILDADPTYYTSAITDGHFSADWFNYRISNGADGQAPPDGHPLWDVWALVDEISVTSNDAARMELWRQVLQIHADNLFTIGTVGEQPNLTVVRHGFCNVPEAMVSDDPLRNVGLAQPAQFFFASDGDCGS